MASSPISLQSFDLDREQLRTIQNWTNNIQTGSTLIVYAKVLESHFEKLKSLYLSEIQKNFSGQITRFEVLSSILKDTVPKDYNYFFRLQTALKSILGNKIIPKSTDYSKFVVELQELLNQRKPSEEKKDERKSTEQIDLAETDLTNLEKTIKQRSLVEETESSSVKSAIEEKLDAEQKALIADLETRLREKDAKFQTLQLELVSLRDQVAKGETERLKIIEEEKQVTLALQSQNNRANELNQQLIERQKVRDSDLAEEIKKQNETLEKLIDEKRLSDETIERLKEQLTQPDQAENVRYFEQIQDLTIKLNKSEKRIAELETSLVAALNKQVDILTDEKKILQERADEQKEKPSDILQGIVPPKIVLTSKQRTLADQFMWVTLQLDSLN